MTTRLTKTSKVLTNEAELNTASRFTYLQRDEETGHVLNKAAIERQVAIDLGSPREITVTIEAGNTLEDPVSATEDPEYHDEDTLLKVYAVLMDAGLDEEETIGTVSELQNAGILFRERR